MWEEGQQQRRAPGSEVSWALTSPCPGPEDWCCFLIDVRKPRLREVKCLVQGHTASPRGHRQILSPCAFHDPSLCFWPQRHLLQQGSYPAAGVRAQHAGMNARWRGSNKRMSKPDSLGLSFLT